MWITSHISDYSQRRATAGTERQVFLHQVLTCCPPLSPSLVNNACRLVNFVTAPDSHAAVSTNHLYLHSTWRVKVIVYGSRHVNV